MSTPPETPPAAGLPPVVDDRTVILNEEGERRWRLAVQPRVVLVVENKDWQQAAAWLDGHLATTEARAACAAWAGACLGMTDYQVLAISPALRGKFSALLDRCAANAPARSDDEHELRENGAPDLCREILGWPTRAVAPLLARLCAWANIVPPEPLPAVLLNAEENVPALLQAGDRLARHGYPVGLRVSQAGWDTLLAGGSWDRATTRWRHASPADDEISRQPANANNAPDEVTRRFAAATAPEAVALLARASEMIAREKSSGREELSNEARSAAEALLFAVLEARPLTARRFALNVPLPFVFGLRKAEADLCAEDARLVVEIDGYFHFRDVEGYRRDRSKDALFQEHGWFVHRFLAEDVVSHLEDVVAQIERTLARRDARVSRPLFPTR